MTLRLDCFAAAAVFAVAIAAFVIAPIEAHKPITSKYTYNDDVYPIFRERCGRCHITGGVGPMSLLTYKEAYPWAESIRGELLAETMPPWHAEEGFGSDRTLVATLSPRELDVMLVWATGGTPQGNAAKTPPPVALKNDWPLGTPDLVVQPENPLTLAPEKQEETTEFTLGTGLTRARRVRAVDLRPGNPAMVRHAEIRWRGPLRSRSGAPALREDPNGTPPGLLAHWAPGADPVVALPGREILLPAGAQLHVRIHYKRTWLYEGTALSDRSSVGLYFADTRPGVKAGLVGQGIR